MKNAISFRDGVFMNALHGGCFGVLISYYKVIK
jgi:hypothetical protein